RTGGVREHPVNLHQPERQTHRRLHHREVRLMVMERHFDQDLQQLKERLLTMGSLAETMIHSAIKALVDRKVGLVEDVYRHETEVNALQIEVDDRCLKMIALHQPAASDLRFIT